MDAETLKEIQEYCTIFDKINPNEIAQQIIEKIYNEAIITLDDTDEMFSYNKLTGLYEPCEKVLENTIQLSVGKKTTTHFCNEVLASVRRQTRKKREEIQPPVQYIPLKNCIYNMLENTILPYSDENIFFSKHPIEYLPEEKLALDDLNNPIEKFLEEITEKEEDILLIKEIIGYCFYRGMPFHIIAIFVGTGANGKSTLLNLLQEMIGKENISNETFQALTNDKFASAQLENKNANIFFDLPNKSFKDVGILKAASGGDLLKSEKKFQQGHYFKNYAKLIASCNEIPETPDQSDAFYRRWLIINFPNCFEGKENRNLLQELCTEYNKSLFFNHCIDAFRLAMLANAFIRKEGIAEKRTKYNLYSSSPSVFCEKYVEQESGNYIPTKDVYNKYLEFCKAENIQPKNEVWFFKSLYKFFGNNNVWKRRIEVGEGNKECVVEGIWWK